MILPGVFSVILSHNHDQIQGVEDNGPSWCIPAFHHEGTEPDEAPNGETHLVSANDRKTMAMSANKNPRQVFFKTNIHVHTVS